MSSAVRIPPPTVSGTNTSRPSGGLTSWSPRFMRGGDIQKHDFVRALRIVGLGAFHGVAHLFDSDKIDAFDHFAVPHVQAGMIRFASICIHPLSVLHGPAVRSGERLFQIERAAVQRFSADHAVQAELPAGGDVVNPATPPLAMTLHDTALCSASRCARLSPSSVPSREISV